MRVPLVALALGVVPVAAQEGAPPRALAVSPSGFANDGERRESSRQIESFVHRARQRDGTGEGDSVLPLRADERATLRAVLQVAELGAQERFAFRSFELAPSSDPARGAPPSFRLPTRLPQETVVLLLECTVVEPGCCVFLERGAEGSRIDWLGPEHFVEPPEIRRSFRGTRLAKREAERSACGPRGTPASPPLELRDGESWSPGGWARAYCDRLSGPDAPNSDRSPLRLLEYRVGERIEGEDGRIDIATCYSLEELHYVLSRVWWLYRTRGVDAPALEIRVDRDTVLTWGTAKPGTPTGEDRPGVAALLTKPRYAPFPLAQNTFDRELGFAAFERFSEDPRRCSAFYQALGWNVQVADLLEILELLAGPPLTAAVARQKAPRWSADDPWPLEAEHSFRSTFGMPMLRLSSGAAHTPDCVLDQGLYGRDRRPLDSYIRSHEQMRKR